ncbi:MAG TPA: hypothetical protein VM925_12075 [Labilithrix sp.]|nr:hypothetical protein [Labilithrix sp.]
MTKLVIDSERSRIRIQTFAEGLFARLAHDLELVCRECTGSAERVSDDRGSANLEIPISKIDVSGTLKNGHVDPNGLSPSDRADCLAKMRKDVFHVSGDAREVVRIEATAEGGKARVRVTPPNGRGVDGAVTVRIVSDADTVRVSGRFAVSLDAIGAAPVKGPMNAFRVKDAVELLFDVVFREAR